MTLKAHLTKCLNTTLRKIREKMSPLIFNEAFTINKNCFFSRDLSPEFLQSIDPDIIVEYFNNASPEDLKVQLVCIHFLLISAPRVKVREVG